MLDLAEVDSRIGQARHQLRTLPQVQEIAALDSNRRTLDDRVRDARIRVTDLAKEQKKAETDVEQVRARRERDRTRMDQGLITNPKDLQRMTHELESLERRISDLEDAELEVMEQLEQAQAELDRALDEQGHLETKLAELATSRDTTSAEIQAALATAESERAPALDGIPEPLLALYERIREKQGVGAAALRARQCGGCQLRLNPSDLAVIAKAPVDEVVRCEECGRILVRTPESGL
ncbi:C4-type zinc ribbon domain-containing protein [Nocardioides sp. AE5]|uniref:zinc ribbon domain-containing protein n=1 Tax=Nocardioides sp. AE5 TaxID=2962573 RepID=UPI0028813173|nr:C4-type zinc ribbon domain-containing protein [Nocardioides sp. AE5]MDT0203337.1 C4-type zinc ribbon domain-containing protein [Nocardioides sp. AE5]